MPCLNGSPNLTRLLSAFKHITLSDSHSDARQTFKMTLNGPSFLVFMFYESSPLHCGLDL